MKAEPFHINDLSKRGRRSGVSTSFSYSNFFRAASKKAAPTHRGGHFGEKFESAGIRRPGDVGNLHIRGHLRGGIIFYVDPAAGGAADGSEREGDGEKRKETRNFHENGFLGVDAERN